MLFDVGLASAVNSAQRRRGIIVPYQKLFMSLEWQEELLEGFPFQSLKINNQNTTICVKQKTPSNITSDLDLPSSFLDCSFERAIYQENMEILSNSVSKYLEESLVGPFDRNEGFRDKALYENLPFEVGGQCELEMLTLHNQLLTQRDQQELVGMVRNEEELLGLIRQVVPVFGITVGKEVVLAIYHLLKLKLQTFQQMRQPKDTLIPRFDCFQGFEEDETFITTACSLYEDLNLEEVPTFAEEGLEELSSMLYFSCQLKYLNLREIKPDTKGNVLHRFNTLLRQISRTLFYTLAGAIEPAIGSNSSIVLDLSREVSFSELSEATLGMRRLLSRPSVPCEDEPQDFLSKMRKLD